MSNKSPVPKKIKEMSFYEILPKVMEGKKIASKVWPKSVYGFLSNDGFLSIFTKGKTHQWIISDGDLTATDWKIV